MSQKNQAARLLKEIARRRTAETEKRMADLAERARVEAERYAAAFGPRPAWCDWEPWGYLLDDEATTEAEEEQVLAEAWQAANPPSLLDLRPDDTQFLPVLDFVLANEFPTRVPAQRTGAVL